MQRSKFEKLVRQFPFLRDVSSAVWESRHDEINQISVKRIDDALLECTGYKHLADVTRPATYFYLVSADHFISIALECVVFEDGGKDNIVQHGEKVGEAIARIPLSRIIAVVRCEPDNTGKDIFLTVYLPPRDWRKVRNLSRYRL